MLKKASIALVLASLVSTTALADGSHAATSASGGEDHLVLKVRAGWLKTDEKVKGYPAGQSVKFDNGYTGELALGYFFTDNVALEASAGYGKSKLKVTNRNSKNVSIVPVSALVQYHFMPEASVSPYVGVGYSYQFISNTPANVKFKNGGGVVGQVGLDIPYNDTMGFNIDAKYTHKADHKLTSNNRKYTAHTNSTAVQAGVTFSF